MDQDMEKSRRQFLGNAITDISGYIRFIDTKVGIILAFVGAAATLLVRMKADLQCILSSSGGGGALLGILLVTEFIAAFDILCCSFAALTVRVGRIEGYDSKWFFPTPDGDFSEGFRKYAGKVSRMTEEDITENLAAELYKLNDIYRKKLRYAGKTVYAFQWFALASLFIIVILMTEA